MKKKFIVPLLAAVLIVSNGITALAAPEVINVNGTNTVFDYEYYAAANPDVAAAFGLNRDALIQHYIAFGKAENRPAYASGTDVDALLASAQATLAQTKKKRPIRKEGYYDGTRLDYVIIYQYDEYGNVLTETTNYTTGTEVKTKKYTYDARGNVLTGIETYKDGKDVDTTEYIYDDHGNVLTTTKYTTQWPPDYRQVEQYSYTYDDKGNIIVEIKITATGYVMTTRYEYTYDENGNILAETSYSESGYHHTTEYTYDSKGNLLTKGWKTEYTYDEQGNILTEFDKDYGFKGLLIKYIYE